jgi:hypothetical protein
MAVPRLLRRRLPRTGHEARVELDASKVKESLHHPDWMLAAIEPQAWY